MDGSSRGRSRDRAQSSTIGFAIIIGLTLAAAASIVVFGSAALDEGQRNVEINQAEHALTQFDSRVAQVALGDSSSQRVSLGTTGGTYSVDEDAGKVWVVHEEWNGTGTEEVILSGRTLGAITYDRGDTTIAYQGGGVWRVDDEGGATMISPPEFHYRAPTLTFPIIRVEGDGSSGGRSTARVRRSTELTTLFPDADETYANSDPYENPVEEGNMTVTVQSEYCEAWRSYFADRTDGEVTDCDADGNVTAELITRGQTGVIQNVRGGNELEVRGKDDGPTMRDLKFTLTTSESQSSDFSNFEWSISAEGDAGQFEIYFRNDHGNNYCGETARTVVFYNDSGSGSHYTWIDDDEDGDGFVFDCSGDRDTITIDLTNETLDVEHEQMDSNDLEAFNADKNDFENGTQLYGPDEYYAGDPGDKESINTTVQYYLDQFDDPVTLEFNEGNNAGIGSNSEGFVDYDGDDRTVTYLQVTENRVEVRFE